MVVGLKTPKHQFLVKGWWSKPQLRRGYTNGSVVYEWGVSAGPLLVSKRKARRRGARYQVIYV